MAFPINPTEGQIFNKYIYKSNGWQLRINSTSPASGDINLGQLYLLSPATKNNLAFTQTNPVTNTVFIASVAAHIPAGTKGVMIRWWVQKATPAEANAWYWAGFAAGDDTASLSTLTSASICTGSEFSGGGTYHHDVISVPVDSSGNFKILFSGVGLFANFNYNILGYYI